MAVDLLQMSFEEMEALFASIPTRSGNPTHRATAVMRAMCRDQVRSVSDIEGLAKDFKAPLERIATVSRPVVSGMQEAEDGTRKYRYALADGAEVESVWIPEHWGSTLCLSSQAGCAMGCTFCRTAQMGLGRNLTQAEILGQVLGVMGDVDSAHGVTNIVFMGMGEPLHNYDAVVRAIHVLLHPAGFALSHNRVTVSTVGLVPEMDRLGQEVPVNLCISLHAARDELRDTLVPVNRKYPLREVLEACQRFPHSVRRKLMFAYVVLPGVNDTENDAADLAALLDGVANKVNLIPFNSFGGAQYRSPSVEEVTRFQNRLLGRGLRALYRSTRGDEIAGACGQLATESGRR
jgi:23S rRNA (adenine2503-C2)-methyltransferase